jgi:hypothetical protein
MALKIIKADERLKRTSDCVKAVVFGPAGVGKTYQARTLDAKTTLFVDLEAGTLALGKDWKGDVLDIRATSNDMAAHPWELAKAIALWLGGPDPADANGSYSAAAYKQVCEAFGSPDNHKQYETLFVDSITVASRMCFAWCQTQPDAFSEKTGKPDIRGAYGLLGREMIRWVTQLQHCHKNVVLVGILEQQEDELKRKYWDVQIEGSKTGRELPGIFDLVLTLQNFEAEDKSQYRAFVCHQQNPWGYPAKDRSGTLELQEPADLGKVLAKIRAGKRIDTTQKN